MIANELDHKAHIALSHWGPVMARPRLISHRENAVFEVHLPDGQRAALRLHRPGYCTEAEIQSELWWTTALADRGFPVPRPVRNVNGAFLQTTDDGQYATVISWVDGEPFGQSGEPLSGTLEDQTSLFYRIGTMLAELHQLSDALEPPAGFTRRAWDAEGFLGPEPLWGRFWESPSLDSNGVEIVQKARQKAFRTISDYASAGGDFGLIHADALRENVFRSGDKLTLIDFDDSGFGFRMYDLAVAVSQSIDDPEYGVLVDALYEGYSSLRPLSGRDKEMFRVFALMRSFASLGWVIPRLPPDHSSGPRFARRAVDLSKAFLEG